MKVLVACEFSGIVRDAFIAEGHDAISCDLLPTESPGPHIQGDVRPLLQEPWDLVIAHPPCNYLTQIWDTFSRNRQRGQFWLKFADGVQFFRECLNANAPRVAVENPKMHKFSRKALGHYDMLLQPYEFGDSHSKATAFWVRNLPPLMSSLFMPEHRPLVASGMGNFDGQTTWRKNGGRGIARENGHDRSRFSPGMAKAMAIQWGSYGN